MACGRRLSVAVAQRGHDGHVVVVGLGADGRRTAPSGAGFRAAGRRCSRKGSGRSGCRSPRRSWCAARSRARSTGRVGAAPRPPRRPAPRVPAEPSSSVILGAASRAAATSSTWRTSNRCRKVLGSICNRKLIGRASSRGVERRHICPPAVAGLDHVHGREDPDRLAHRGPADPEHDSQVALGRQGVPRAQLPGRR